MMDVTGIKICWACLSAIKETLETFSWETVKGISRKDNIQTEQIFRRRASRRRQMMVKQCITANVTQIITWWFTGEDSADSEECPPSCWLQLLSIMPTQTQAALLRKHKELNVEKLSSLCSNISLLLREILSDGTEDLIEMCDCYRQTWLQLFWIWNLKILMFICLNMLEIENKRQTWGVSWKWSWTQLSLQSLE